jgi:hypothetical protein
MNELKREQNLPNWRGFEHQSTPNLLGRALKGAQRLNQHLALFLALAAPFAAFQITADTSPVYSQNTTPIPTLGTFRENTPTMIPLPPLNTPVISPTPSRTPIPTLNSEVPPTRTATPVPTNPPERVVVPNRCDLRTDLTYYHRDLIGDRMANGRPYDQTDPSIAANNTIPLGQGFTIFFEDRSIVVVNQDRGHSSLGVDLSEAGFRRLSPSGTLHEGRLRNACIVLNR